MDKAIDLYMISGFFGSGKTTFLGKFLDSFQGQRTAVLVNEAGQIGIDTERLRRERTEIKEITNGSLYCACLKADFIRALIGFSTGDSEVLCIENSGASDPANIHRILAETEDKVKRPYRYRGSICVADAVRFLKQIRVLPAVENQIRSAGCILVNKTDLATEKTVDEVHAEVQKINPKANLYDTSFGDIPADRVKQELKDNEFDADSTNICSDKPVSLVMECTEPVAEERLALFLAAEAAVSYRIKGSVLTDGGWKQTDAAEEQAELRAEENLHPVYSRLVFILKGKEDRKEALMRDWEKICGTEAVFLN